MQSLKSKGFLRAYKNYEPPADLETKFLSCISDSLQKNITDLNSVQNMEIASLQLKLKLLNSLNREFSHKVHNSRLHQMKTIGDLFVYYKVKTQYNIVSCLNFFGTKLYKLNHFDIFSVQSVCPLPMNSCMMTW